MDHRQQLENQLGQIEAACRAYDAGNRNEATQLAMLMKSIFYDSAQTPSLLGLLKSHLIDLLSTATKPPSNVTGGHWSGLIQWELDPVHSLFITRPKLNAGKASHRVVASRFWWDSEPVYQFGPKKVKRRDLILGVANISGGPRTELKLPPEYQSVIDGSLWRITIKPDPLKPQREILLPFAQFAAIRQIAHETLHSQALLKLAGR